MKKIKQPNHKLFFITGAPASGKLTIGQLLSKKTGIPLFHNHILIDLAKEIFPEAKNRHAFREPLFFNILTFAAKNKHSLILTYAYAQNFTSKTGLNDVGLVKKVKKIIESHGGEFISIHLTPSTKELLSRIKGASRKKFTKIKDASTMKQVLKEWDTVTPPPIKDGLVIDNSKLSANEVVKIILKKLEEYEKNL